MNGIDPVHVSQLKRVMAYGPIHCSSLLHKEVFFATHYFLRFSSLLATQPSQQSPEFVDSSLSFTQPDDPALASPCICRSKNKWIPILKKNCFQLLTSSECAHLGRSINSIFPLKGIWAIQLIKLFRKFDHWDGEVASFHWVHSVRLTGSQGESLEYQMKEHDAPFTPPCCRLLLHSYVDDTSLEICIGALHDRCSIFFLHGFIWLNS